MISYMDLLDKDIINIKNGENIGRFTDVEVDVRRGRVVAFYIEEGTKILSFLGKTRSKRVRWEDIIRVGVDVIVVNLEDEDSRNINSMMDEA